MRLDDYLGKRLVAATERGDDLVLQFEDGTSIEVGVGDAGSMRSPEPYFSLRLLPPDPCREWAGFSVCGNQKPCPTHGARK